MIDKERYREIKIEKDIDVCIKEERKRKREKE